MCRWESIRATEGWAALQHHAVLRTTLTLYPPSDSVADSKVAAPRLLVQLKQGSYFTVLPSNNHSGTPQWHSGNIYALERALPRAVDLPVTPSYNAPTQYDIYVSGDYEVL